MKEFTSLITVEPIADASSKKYAFYADHFEFVPTATEDDNGLLWQCDKTFVVDMPSPDIARVFAIARSAIVTLHVAKGQPLQIGTAAFPARVRISPHLNRAHLIIVAKQPVNPFG
jgi:hypothetical protein